VDAPAIPADVKRILCAGECMLELTHTGERTLALGFAGDTYNAAVYLRRVATALGADAEVGYLTGLGEDAYSAAMRAAWAENGVRDRSVTVEGRIPGLYAIRTAGDGEREFTYWREASAARAFFAGPGFPAALEGELVHLSGITLQLTTPASRAALLDRLRELRAGGTTVSFDTNYRPAGWPDASDAAAAMAAVCETADIVLASDDDERLMHGEETAEDALARLRGHGAAEVVLRAGEAGAHVAAGGAVRHVPAAPVAEVVDTTAAGDAWAGAYLAARLAGRAPVEAAEVANAVAAVVVQHRGAVIDAGVELLR
jgi:2-dehydro-3-deoxygluconokinase